MQKDLFHVSEEAFGFKEEITFETNMKMKRIPERKREKLGRRK